MPQRVTIGAVRFLNSAPLVHGLAERADVALRLEDPSALAPLLLAGDVDAALMPAIEYFRLSAEAQERVRPRRPDGGSLEPFVVLPVAAIVSAGPIGSIRLFGYAPMAKVRRVLLDPASRSANAMTRILFARRFGGRPHFAFPHEVGPDPARGPDAELLIGDRGLVAERPEAEWVLDLGLEWNRFVHRPFVYAVWVARADARLARLSELLADARDAGLAAREDIAARAEAERGIPADVARRHLESQVKYAFGRKEREGLMLFYRMAAEEGLAPPGVRLRFPKGT
jgi:chorismate dehydratase